MMAKYGVLTKIQIVMAVVVGLCSVAMLGVAILGASGIGVVLCVLQAIAYAGVAVVMWKMATTGPSHL